MERSVAMTEVMIEGEALTSVCCEEGDSGCLLDEVLEGLAETEDDVCPSDSWLCERLDERGPGADVLGDTGTGVEGERGLGVRSSSSESEMSASGGHVSSLSYRDRSGYLEVVEVVVVFFVNIEVAIGCCVVGSGTGEGQISRRLRGVVGAVGARVGTIGCTAANVLDLSESLEVSVAVSDGENGVVSPE
jgi:hypothetical protein